MRFQIFLSDPLVPHTSLLRIRGTHITLSNRRVPQNCDTRIPAHDLPQGAKGTPSETGASAPSLWHKETQTYFLHI